MDFQRIMATIIGTFIFIGLIYILFLFAWYIAIPVIIIAIMLSLIITVVNKVRGRKTTIRFHRVSKNPDIIDVDFREIP